MFGSPKGRLEEFQVGEAGHQAQDCSRKMGKGSWVCCAGRRHGQDLPTDGGGREESEGQHCRFWEEWDAAYKRRGDGGERREMITPKLSETHKLVRHLLYTQAPFPPAPAEKD